MNLAYCELSYCFLLLFCVSSWVERNLIKIIKKHCNKGNLFQWLFCHLTVPEIKGSPRWFCTYSTLLVVVCLPYPNCLVICASVWLFIKRCESFGTCFWMSSDWRPKPSPAFTWLKHHTMRKPVMTDDAKKRPHCSKDVAERVTGFHSSTLPFFVSECLSWPHLLQCHVSVMVCPVPSLHRATELNKILPISSPKQTTLGTPRVGLDWPAWPCSPPTLPESLKSHARGSTVAMCSIL